MPLNIRFVSTYPPRKCGIGTFCRDLSNSLTKLTGEIGHIRIAAIDNNHGPYNIPVDLVIDQYNPQSWSDVTNAIITRAKETDNPTAVVLQHEYGLDPSDDGIDGCGDNYVKMAKACIENGFTTLVYLHTVLESPNDHQKRIMQNLAQYSDGLIVTTESAIDILESPTYGIGRFNLKHIDHGIRMHNPTQYDRFSLKSELGLKDFFLAATIGLLSPSKGIQYSIQGYGKFINESCTPAQRKRMIYLIAGQCHPEFVKAEDGKYYKEYMATLEKAIKDSQMKCITVNDITNIDWENNDIVFFDNFLEESMLLEIYGMSNCVILPYMNMEQISSGILADAIGSGRVAIATKFRYALELIYSNKQCPPGLVVGRFARGILIDSEEASIYQIAQALDYLVFEKEKRIQMEKQAHQRGYQMRWDNSAWALTQYIQFVSENKEITTGRGIKFLREKPSILQRKKNSNPQPSDDFGYPKSS